MAASTRKKNRVGRNEDGTKSNGRARNGTRPKVGAAARQKAALVTQNAVKSAKEHAARRKRKAAEEVEERELKDMREERFPPVGGFESSDDDDEESEDEEDNDDQDEDQNGSRKDAEMMELRNQVLHMKRQLEAERRKETVPTAIVTEGADVTTAVTMTTVSAGPKLSVPQQKACLEERVVNGEISDQLRAYVTKQIFRTAKFALPKEKEREVCMHAVRLRKVLLPGGVAAEVFAEKYRDVVRKRMNKLRSNVHASCKLKFESKCDLFVSKMKKRV